MPRLLIVDDEESICFSMSEYFSLHGYKVDTAREMEEAEKLLGATEYKVVIQDLRLNMKHDADGLEMIRLVKEQNPQARIIVLTAYGSAEMEDEARRRGADAFLRKPKPLSQVAQVVQGLIESPPRQAARPGLQSFWSAKIRQALSMSATRVGRRSRRAWKASSTAFRPKPRRTTSSH